MTMISASNGPSWVSAMYPANTYFDRLVSYLPYENTIDCRSLTFPVCPNQFSVFENDNPSIALHCLSYDALTIRLRYCIYRLSCMSDRIRSPCYYWNHRMETTSTITCGWRIYLVLSPLATVMDMHVTSVYRVYICLPHSMLSRSTRVDALCTDLNNVCIQIATKLCYAMNGFNMSFHFYFIWFPISNVF